MTSRTLPLATAFGTLALLAAPAHAGLFGKKAPAEDFTAVHPLPVASAPAPATPAC